MRRFPSRTKSSAFARALATLFWASALSAADSTDPRWTTSIYERANHLFLQADYFKPLERNGFGQEFDLAPLLLQEVPQTKTPSAGLDRFGSLCFSNNRLSLDYSRAKIYVVTDTVDLNRRPHLRSTYLWVYNLEPIPASRSTPPVQGLRLTLGADAKPQIVEVLADVSNTELVFVSKTVENAARAEYGMPLAQRRFAIERSQKEQPQVVVARVIEPGPVPMGPVVYLSAGTHSLSTLICRCMPAQAKTLLQTSTYELVSAGSDDLARLALARVQSKAKVCFWPGDTQIDKRLERCLRLPHAF